LIVMSLKKKNGWKIWSLGGIAAVLGILVTLNSLKSCAYSAVGIQTIEASEQKYITKEELNHDREHNAEKHEIYEQQHQDFQNRFDTMQKQTQEQNKETNRKLWRLLERSKRWDR